MANKKLKEAAKIGREMNLQEMTQDTPKQMKQALPQGMKKISDTLRKTAMGRAIKQQDETVEVLEKMIDALDDSRQPRGLFFRPHQICAL